MWLCFHVASTTRRIVLQIAVDRGRDREYRVVDGVAASLEDNAFVAI